ncbi:TorF family putative porin (plasmid) [Dechloromonas sp. ARDL1]|uniref:TorF family putative porin n=1 Tax=Dechloromonas sp. ARDL1 TaxID=3322121 RepID=UPI003DA6F1B4
MHKYVFSACLLATTLPAVAQSGEVAPTPEHSLTGNVGVVSQYVFRGLSQTDGKPAVQGGFDYAHVSGFYLGTWLSNISWFTDQNAGVKNAPVSLASPGSVGAPYTTGASNSASLEWDFYGGYKNSFGDGWTYDVGLIRYYYPGRFDNLGAYRKPDTTEVYGAIGYKWLTLKYSKAISTYTFGVNESRGASYLDLSAQIPVGETGYNILAHVGRQNYPGKSNVGYWGASGGDNNFFDYTDYKLGLAKEYQGFNFGLTWTYADTKHTAPDGNTTAYMNAFGRNIGRDRVVASVSKSF